MEHDYVGATLLAVLTMVGLARLVPLILEDACMAIQRSLEIVLQIVRVVRTSYNDLRDILGTGASRGRRPSAARPARGSRAHGAGLN